MRATARKGFSAESTGASRHDGAEIGLGASLRASPCQAFRPHKTQARVGKGRARGADQRLALPRPPPARGALFLKRRAPRPALVFGAPLGTSRSKESDADLSGVERVDGGG